MYVPHNCYHGQFDRSSSNLRKSSTLCIPTLKVTHGHWNQQATYDFILVFHSNYVLGQRYLLNFSTLVYLMPLLMGFPLGFCNGVRARETRIMPLSKKFDNNMSTRLDQL